MKFVSCETRNEAFAAVLYFKFLASLAHVALGQWKVLVGRQARGECWGCPSSLALELLTGGLWMWDTPLEGQVR